MLDIKSSRRIDAAHMVSHPWFAVSEEAGEHASYVAEMESRPTGVGRDERNFKMCA
jgi:hypothetical protein